MHATLRATESMARVSQARPGDLPSDEVIPKSRALRVNLSDAAGGVFGSREHRGGISQARCARVSAGFFPLKLFVCGNPGAGFRRARKLDGLSGTPSIDRR